MLPFLKLGPVTPRKLEEVTRIKKPLTQDFIIYRKDGILSSPILVEFCLGDGNN
jgi:hypothetical protein